MGRHFSDEEIIRALLQSGSSRGAARLLGCTPVTIRKRRQNADFARKYQDAKDELLGETVSRLRTASKVAVEVLTKIAENGENNAQSRANASNYILAHFLKYQEIADVSERVTRLEERLSEQEH